MAPVGHTVVQAPQPTHRLKLTLTRFCDFSLLIASAEQLSMQALQPTCSLRAWAQMAGLYCTKRGFSNSPTSSRSFSSVPASRPSPLR